MSSSLRLLAAKLKTRKPAGRISKSSRTLSLSEPQFSELQAHCQRSGLAVSHVLDDLITIFLDEEVRDEEPTLSSPNAKLIRGDGS